MAVIGASPVSFISEDPTTNHGKQYQIPLSLLSFDTSGTIVTTGWSEYGSLEPADKTLVTTLLASLVSQGLLTKPP
jgi:hypothetical protein